MQKFLPAALVAGAKNEPEEPAVVAMPAAVLAAVANNPVPEPKVETDVVGCAGLVKVEKVAGEKADCPKAGADVTDAGCRPKVGTLVVDAEN